VEFVLSASGLAQGLGYLAERMLPLCACEYQPLVFVCMGWCGIAMLMLLDRLANMNLQV
jgi:hypothetical protein